MSDIICKCGHGISYHDDTDGLGCLADVTPTAENRWRTVCPCEITCADIESANHDTLFSELQTARAEIERLETENKMLRSIEKSRDAELEQSNAEIEWLANALKSIAKLGGMHTPLVEKMQNIARAALKGAE